MMDHPVRRYPEDSLERLSRGVTRWVLGPGLLSLHGGVYLVSLVTLLLWNFARSPNDVWVDGPLRRWGLVVVFHGTAVAAGWAAWRLMRLGTTPAAPDTGSGTARTWTVPAAPPPVADTHVAPPSRNAVATATAEEWARRWLRQSVRIVRDAVAPGGLANGASDDAATVRPAASAVAGPEITEWGTLFARRAREMMSSARDHLSPSASRATNGSPMTNGSPLNPASTWPGGVESGQHTPADAMRSSPLNGTWPAPANDPSRGDEIAGLQEFGNGAAPPKRTGLDPLKAAAGADDASRDDTAANEAARWTWVEAAAAAWLARREVDEPVDNPAETPQPPGDEPTATP